MRVITAMATKGKLVEWQEVDDVEYNSSDDDVLVTTRCINVDHVIGLSLVPESSDSAYPHVLIVTAGGKLRVHGKVAELNRFFDMLFDAIIRP